MPFCGGRQPLLFVALAFASGLVMARFVWHPAFHWIAAALLLMGFAALLARKNATFALIAGLLAAVMTGALAYQTRPAHSVVLPPAIEQGECEVIAHAVRDGVLERGMFGGQQQVLDVETEAISLPDGSRLTKKIGLRISIYARKSDYEDEEQQESGTLPMPLLKYGQRVLFTAKLHEPRNYRNPGAWDYRAYLQTQGIALLGSARVSSVAILPGFGGSRWAAWQHRARASVIRKIHEVWPLEEASLLAAVLIGERAELGRDVKTSFQSTGTFHILVVSGMNVGILAFAVFWLSRHLGFGDVLSTFCTLVVAFGYAWLTDLGSPILRAVWTLTVYLLARLLYRENSRLNAIAVAALVILAWDPEALFDAGFQLTFLSVMVIAGVVVPWIGRTSDPYRRALRNLHVLRADRAHKPLPQQFRLDLRMICGRLERVMPRRLAQKILTIPLRALYAAYELVLVSTLMEFTLALPMAFYFHRVTLMAPVANALVVPLTGILMPACATALLLAYIAHPLAHLPAFIGLWSLRAITGTVALFGHLRVSTGRVATPSLGLSLAAGAAVAAAMALARRRWWIAAIGIGALFASGAAILFAHPKLKFQPNALEITAIDVGQGDSLLVVFPDGKTMLMDSGGPLGGAHSEFDIGEQVVSPYLWWRGIERLDAVAFSHPHSDHMGAMPTIIRNFHPRELWIGLAPPVRDVENILIAARDENTRLVFYRTGDERDFGGTHIRVLLPQKGQEPHIPPKDDDVLALKISYGRTSALFVGDSHKNKEQEMLNLAPQADFLKVAHHGSNTSSTSEFLAAVHPKYGVISVGARNSFKHPRPEVLQRLAAFGVRTYRTDLAGASTFFLDGERITATAGPGN